MISWRCGAQSEPAGGGLPRDSMTRTGIVHACMHPRGWTAAGGVSWRGGGRRVIWMGIMHACIRKVER